MMNLEMLQGVQYETTITDEDRFTDQIRVAQHQERMWSADESSEGPGQNHWTIVHITGPLNVSSLFGAYEDVINKHLILKSAFAIQDNELFQKVFQREKWSFDVLDFDRASDSEIRHFLAREARRSFRLHIQPAIRAILVKGKDCFYFSLGIHPMVADKASIAVFWNDLIHRYQVVEEGGASKFHSKGLQYAAIANEQRMQPKVSDGNEIPEPWQHEFSAFEHSPITVDVLETTEDPVTHSILNAQISEEKSQLIEDQSTRHKIDSHLFFLTAYKMLLYQSSGEKHLIVGCPFDCRDKYQESVIGPFEKVLPIPSMIDPNQSFLDLAAVVKQGLLKASAFRHDELHNIKIQSKLVFEDYSAPDFVNFRDVRFEWKVSPMESSPFEFQITIIKGVKTFGLYVTYRTDVFTKATISNLLERFQEILTLVATFPDIPISVLLADNYASEREFLNPTEATTLFQTEIDLM